MSTWRKIGIAEVDVDALDNETLQDLIESRSPEADTPFFLDPSALNEFVSYLYNLESPSYGGPGYIKFRNVLLASAWRYETADGNSVVVLDEPTESFTREKIAELMEEDRRDLLALGSTLNHAVHALSEEGVVPTHAFSATESVDCAAGAMDSFLTK